MRQAESLTYITKKKDERVGSSFFFHFTLIVMVIGQKK